VAALRGSKAAREAIAVGERPAIAGELLSDSFVASPTGAEDVVGSPDGRLWAVGRRPLHIPLTADPPYAAAGR